MQDEKHYDLYVKQGDGVDLDEVRDRALNIVQMEPAKTEALINALQGGNRVCIGKGVSEERAESAWQKMTRIGLEFEAEVSLALVGVVYNCQSCQQSVQLTTDRQCPKCGVFVDKLTETQESNQITKEWDTNGSRLATMGRGHKDKKTNTVDAYVKAGAASHTSYADIPSDGTVAIFLLMTVTLFVLLMNDTVWSEMPEPLYYFFYHVLPYIGLAAQGLAIFSAYRLRKGRVALGISFLLVLTVLIENTLPLLSYLAPSISKITPLWRGNIFIAAFATLSLFSAMSLFILSKRKAYSYYSPSDIEEIGSSANSTLGLFLRKGFDIIFLIAFSFLIFVIGIRVAKDISHLDEFSEYARGEHRLRWIDESAR